MAMRKDIEASPLLLESQDSGVAGYIPDLVIVFPRPERQDGPDQLCRGGPDTTFTATQIDSFFDEILVDRDTDESVTCKKVGNLDIYPACTELEARLREKEAQGLLKQLDMVDVQNAMIDDLVRWLTGRGCSTSAFRSCDEDELFLCISLGDSRLPAQLDAVALSFMEDASLKVQSTFDARTGQEKLGVKQRIGPYEEMHVSFSGELVTQMERVLDLPPLDADVNKTSILRKYNDGLGGVSGTVLRTVDRARMLMSLINSFLDLEDAKGLGLIDAYYVPHKLSKLEEFRSGKRAGQAEYDYAHDAWSNFKLRTVLKGLQFWDESQQQPIQEVRDYFGERVAFYFLWLGFTVKALVFAVPITTFVGMMYSLTVGRPVGQAVVYMCAAAMFCLGSALYLKFWTRLQNHYATLWGCKGDVEAENHRPDYRGDLVANPLNENRRTKEYPAHKSLLVKLLAVVVTIVFISMVVAAVAGIYMLQGEIQSRLSWAMSREGEFSDAEAAAATCSGKDFWDPMVCESGVNTDNIPHYDTCCGARSKATSAASALFSAQICVFQILWGFIHLKLIDLANPRTDEQAKDLAVKFLFPFSFVSTYANIGYHAFYTVWNEPCLDSNCLHVMRPAMYMVVLPAIGVQVASMLVPYALYRYGLISEQRELLRRQPGLEVVERSFIEVQAKRPAFGLEELNNDMNVMMILMGYLLLFGFAAPGISAAILITFLVKIRIDAFKLCSVHQRIVPSPAQNCQGIGEWNEVLATMVSFGRWTAFLIPVLNLQYFNLAPEQSWVVRLLRTNMTGPETSHVDEGLTDFQKLLFVFVCKEIMDRVIVLVDYLIPSEAHATKLMHAKREKMRSKMVSTLARKGEGKQDAGAEKVREAIRQLQDGSHKTVEGVRNLNLPKMNSSHPDWANQERSDFAPADKMSTYFGQR